MKTSINNSDSEYSYAIFLCLGIIPWTFFSELLTRTTHVFIDNSHLLKKMNVPKIVFPIICLGSSFFNFLIFYSLFIVFTIFTDIGIYSLITNIFIPLFLLSMMGLSIGLVLALLNVFIRDIGNLVSIILQFWFWLTPIVYNINSLPVKYQQLIAFNPITICVLASQNVIMNDTKIGYVQYSFPLFVSVLFFIIGYFLYMRLSEKLSDEL
jgi:lipopolysaccharide transport system permease protein